MLFVLVDGLYFGLARLKTGSVFISIILHILVNTIAVVEFLYFNG